ncbi:MAG: CheR family methyltransferase [Halobacteriales archaeon]
MPGQDEIPDGFEAVTDFVEENLAFATSHYNDSYLQRRIRSRMRRTGTDGYREYLQHLRDADEEGDKLLEALSINVTGFFRNSAVWDGIRDALRMLTDNRRTVRVWSAACADGREPYSLAMLALDDPRIDASKLSIRGTDINDRALAHAREAVYESNHTSDLDEQLQYLDE